MEDRHIYDIAFGIKCLLQAQVSINDITVLIDNFSPIKVQTVFSVMKVDSLNEIYPIKKLDCLLENNSYQNAVVFITGHGSPDGLDSESPIKPYGLYKLFQTTLNLKRVVMYFGQCYAGIFNQMPLSTHLGLSENRKCSIVATGGTGLFPSLSSTLSVNTNAEKITWSANIFLAYVFDWIVNPRDIDGDGKFSVMDSFKYAAIKTNIALARIKKDNNIQTIMEQSLLYKCVEKLKSGQISDDDKNNLLLEQQALEKMLEIRYIVQEPWILNAQIAMNTEF